MSKFDNIGQLMYLQLEKIDPGIEPKSHGEVRITESEFILEAAIESVKQAEGHNWIPLIVQQIENRYQLVCNQFVYTVMLRANFERAWCIVIDPDQKNIEQAKILSKETVPKVNLCTASKKTIELGLKFLRDEPASPLKDLKDIDVIKIANSMMQANRKTWENFTPIIALKCGIAKGKKLDALAKVFYIDPPEKIIIPPAPLVLSIKKASYDEVVERISYLSTYKIGGFDQVDVEKVSEAIFTATKSKWKSLNPIAKLDCGIETAAQIKILKSVFTL